MHFAGKIEKMSTYEILKKEFKKKNVNPKIGKKVLFLSFSDAGIMKAKIKKIKKDKVIVEPCDPF